MATITGKLEDILGSNEGGSIDIALCGYGSQVPRANGSGLIAQPEEDDIEPDGDGTFNVEVTGNDLIAPAGTYYTVAVKNPNGDVIQVNAYIFLGNNIYDLDLIDPFDPSQPIPPLPPLIINQLLVIAWAAAVTVPGDVFTAFKITLGGNTTITIENMMPGNLYTFIIVQDATGGHTVTWPANAHNATLTDPAPNSTTVQTFVADVDGSLYAIGAGTWLP